MTQRGSMGDHRSRTTLMKFINWQYRTVHEQRTVRRESLGTDALKTQYQKFETNITRKGIARPQFLFPHSRVCERFIYSHEWRRTDQSFDKSSCLGTDLPSEVGWSEKRSEKAQWTNLSSGFWVRRGSDSSASACRVRIPARHPREALYWAKWGNKSGPSAMDEWMHVMYEKIWKINKKSGWRHQTFKKIVLCCQVSGDGRRTVSSLLVTPGEEDAGRTLTCLARNTRDNTSLEAQVTLQVICKYNV